MLLYQSSFVIATGQPEPTHSPNMSSLQEIPWSKNPQVLPSKETETNNFQEIVQLPVDGADVWEIDVKLLKFEYRIGGGSYSDL